MAMATIPRVKLLIETSRAYGQGLLRGIAKYSRLHGSWTFVRETEFYRKDRSSKKTKFNSLPVDGIIAHVGTKKEVDELISTGIASIVQCVQYKVTSHPTISTDDAAIGEMSAGHLLDCGFRHFAFCGFESMYWSNERLKGFETKLKQAGFDVHSFHTPKKTKKNASQQECLSIAEWLMQLPGPLGLMACNDDRSQDVVAACKMANLQIPQDVAIIGVDNDELACDLSDMPLSSIALTAERAGYEVAEMLDQLMSGAILSKKQVVVHPSHVVARRSTDILSIDDHEVVRAVRFIKDHASEMISVDDVIRSVALSRRMAELRFRQVLGRSINEVIQSERIELIRRALIETNLPISKIADKTGFSSPTYMGVVFKKMTGLTPLQYRSELQRH